MKLNLIASFRIVVLVMLVGMLYACRDIIEPSITDRKIIAEAPGNNYQSASYNVQFWWDGVDDALTYRLRMVSPRFDSVARLVLDTVVKSTTFSTNLEPGQYQWQVRAQNGSSQTAYSAPRSFTIFFSSIKQQKGAIIVPCQWLFNESAYTWFSMGFALWCHQIPFAD